MRAEIEVMLSEARALRTEGQAVAALAAYRKSVDMAQSAGEPGLAAHGLRHVSDLAREAGDFDTALQSGTEAVALYRAQAASRPLDLANALRVTALALSALGRGEAAVPMWREARGLYAGLAIEDGVAECDSHLPTPLE